MTDAQPKLDLAGTPTNSPAECGERNLRAVVDELTGGWGVDIVFECSGNERRGRRL